MSLNNKAMLPDEHALDPAYALQPSAAILENGNGQWLPGPLSAAADAASGPQLATYFHALRRHWVLATGLGLLLAFIAGPAVWFGVGARYTADAYLRCAFDIESFLQNRNYRPMPSEMSFEVFKNTQSSMLTNRLVLNAALGQEEKVGEQKIKISKIPELADEDDPVDWLSRKLSVSFPRKDEIMKVSITTKNPVNSAAIVQAVMNSFMKNVVEDERTKRDKRIAELKSIQTKKEEEVKDALNELKKMAKIAGTSESDTLNIQQKNMLDELANLRQQSITLQFNLNRMKSELASLKAAKESINEQPITDIEVQMTCSTDPMLRDLGEQMVYEKAQEQIMGGRIVKNGKSGGNYGTKIGLIEQQYKNRLDELRKELASKKLSEVEREIKKLDAQIEIANKQYADTDVDFKQLKKDAQNIGITSIEVQMRRAANENARKALDSITLELETLNVEARTALRVTKIYEVIEPPRNEASRMIRVALTGMVSFLGFCVPFFGVVVWDMQSKRINNADDVSDRLGLPVIGSVPRIPARILHYQGAPKRGHQTWQLRLTESVDGISARLLRQAETEQRRVVMVTSAVNGEGKTTLTAQLAMSLARAGRRTLLVDFDLRQPTFDEVFGLPKAPGLSEILRGESDLSNCIHATATENLSVLTAGCWDRFALSALANNCLASMFKELREDYEFVIVDTSPILPIADTRFVSQYVDSVVLCVFRDISQAPRIRAACEILEAFGVRSVEAVVTGVNDNLGGKRLGYYRPVESNGHVREAEIADVAAN
ncbi:MAG: polysaccharide biosynthesis tyrosine autokinase [Pirellulales bacterium]|nr:polysaccharide biosynthesis tyrosine autokinase [Pirellulales bacterium]